MGNTQPKPSFPVDAADEQDAVIRSRPPERRDDLIVSQPAPYQDAPAQEPLSRDDAPAAADPDKEDEAEEECKHVYNGVNCCREGKTCKDIADYLRDRPISKIGLDITPTFSTGFIGKERSEELRKERLSRLSSRTWTNLKGQTVAEGRFVDYIGGNIVIADDQGEEHRIAYVDLSDDDRCYVTAWWSLPPECLVARSDYAERNFLPMTMTWKASALCHKPLYFEQVQLERYGHTAGPIKQPIISTAHFFVSLVTIPYQAGMHPWNECIYPVGHYRPGNCAPWLLPAVPISVKGGLLQAAAVVGGVAVIP